MKVFLLNSPHSPTGFAFSKTLIKEISSLLDAFPNILTLADESSENLIYDNKEHVHFAGYGNNWNRTVSVFSGSQLLNCVGWKVGYAIGPKELIRFGGIIYGTVYYCFNTCG